MDLINREPCCESQVKCTNDESISSRLTQRKLRLTAELKDVNDALELLDGVPDIQRVLDAIGRVGRY